MVAAVLAGCTPTAAPPAARRTGQPADAETCLDALQRAWRAGDGAAAARLASGPAARRLALVAHNLQDLRPVELSLSPADPVAGSPPPGQRQVDLTWRLPGDPDPVVTRLGLSVHPGARCVGALTVHGQAPVWVSERVRVLRRGSVVVVVAGTAPAPAEVLEAGTSAVRSVRAVLPRWRGRLVVEVPHDSAGYAAALGVETGDRAGEAAVTTTVGDPRTCRTLRVVLNPALWTGLSPLGARIVVAHEATHVAGHTITSPAPLWLVEGFADYVALREAPIPVRRSAAQFLNAVGRGLPPRLPGDRWFAAGGRRTQIAYQGSWLAVRAIAQRAGEPALVAFYRRALRGAPITRGTAIVSGLDVGSLVGRWRVRMTALARGRGSAPG